APGWHRICTHTPVIASLKDIGARKGEGAVSYLPLEHRALLPGGMRLRVASKRRKLYAWRDYHLDHRRRHCRMAGESCRAWDRSRPRRRHRRRHHRRHRWRLHCIPVRWFRSHGHKPWQHHRRLHWGDHPAVGCSPLYGQPDNCPYLAHSGPALLAQPLRIGTAVAAPRPDRHSPKVSLWLVYCAERRVQRPGREGRRSMADATDLNSDHYELETVASAERA